jgi:predicted metal-binding membrane protein
MLLLFVAGAMNLAWVAIIAAVAFVEKTAPAGLVIGRVLGAAAALIGIGMLALAALGRFP